MWISVLWFALVAAATAGAATPNLLLDGGFERKGTDWILSGDARLDRDVARNGRVSLRIREGGAVQDIVGLAPGSQFTCTAALKLDQVRKTAEAGYAYIAVYQLDDFDEIIASHDFVRLTGTADWQEHSHTFSVAERCRTVSVRCGLFQAVGTAWFDDFTVVAGEEPCTAAQVAAEEADRARRLGLRPGVVGNVAIFKDDIPGPVAAASPDRLAEVLRQARFNTAFLTADQLADPQWLDQGLFDVLLLPYGPNFPLKAAGNFRRFLRQGGKSVSTGGYAFDALLERTPTGWLAPGSAQPPATDHVIWHCELPAQELRGRGVLTFSGWLKASKVSGPGMAFFAIYQTAADGSLPEWKDLCRVTGSQDWREFRYTFNVHPQAATVDLRAGLFRCRGMACFDDIRLADESGHVLLEAGFEEDFNPDQGGPRHWVRSDPRRCEVQSKVCHSGRRALQAKLRFELPREERLNTRHGRPEDGLEVEPTQLGVFQADYRLERVQSAQAASGQCVVEAGLRIKGPLEGYAASGVVGFDQARWVPLMNAHDRYGRLRGAAGALLRHYAGPYAGSSWAFFGVTNRDLFAASEPAMAKALASLVHALVKDVYLASLVPAQACYRQGEELEIVATLANGGRTGRDLRLSVEVDEGEPPGPAGPREEKRLTTLTARFSVPPGETNLVRLRWRLPRLASDFCCLAGRLYDGDEEVDRIESGFVVWNDATVASGPALSFRENYLRLGGRPQFLFGTDDWGYVFNTTRETPLQWLLDMRQRRDFGVDIYENLQFGLPKSPEEQERLLRRVDGIVQLAQKYRQVYFPCLLCGYNVAVSDAELGRQKEFCRAFAGRYASVPGLIYYLNGDLRCHLSDAVTPPWNEFLRQRHGTTERLRLVWGQRAPTQELGAIPAEDFNDWGHAWDDLKVNDQNLFRAWLLRRWHSALIAGIREQDKIHPTTSEFYQLPHEGVDIPAGLDGLDLANFGYFERPGADLARFPPICKFNDQRARGKSTGPGEYGVKTHPAWGDGKDYGYHIARTRQQAIEHYLAIAHYSFALGASRIQNWCWKDDAHRVFPWGMVYPCDNVPKDIAYVHRNQSLLFRQFAPVYHEPSVYVLTADSHRFGGGKWQVLEGILTGISLALATHVENLGTLNELSLDIPSTAKVIFYPLPFCPPDAAYAKVLDWVRQGGVLYLSGDISYDEQRRRTRTNRLEELCGVRFLAQRYPDISLSPTNAEPQPCIQIEAGAARVLRKSGDGSPLLVEHHVGRGRVVFTPDPVELHSVSARRLADVGLYLEVLRLAGIKTIGLEPDDPLAHVFRVPLQDGGAVEVLFNTDDSQPVRRFALSDHRPPIALAVARRRPALLWFDRRGSLCAVESQGPCDLGDQRILENETEGSVWSLDGKDVRESKALVFMPLRPGALKLRSTAAWSDPLLETGDIRNGAWQTYETTRIAAQDHALTIQAGSDQALSLLLLCERAEAVRWRTRLGRMMSEAAFFP